MRVDNSKNKNRKYLIDLQRWRSFVALAACSITHVFSVVSIVTALIYYNQMGWKLTDYFRYFTTLSNLMTAFAAGFIIPFAINGIRLKRFIYPRWLSLMHYAGTIGTTMTMIFALVFIFPWNPELAFGGTQLYLHLICPITVLISFELVESGYLLTRKDTLLCLIPFFNYAALYLVKVVFLGKEKGGWEDLYMLNTFVPVWISLPAILLLVNTIAFLMRKIYNRLSTLRKKKMLSSWNENMDAVEINIEVFGLGRYYGHLCEKCELSIPYDILEALAEKYSMDPEALMKVYTRGLIDAVKEKEARENRDQIGRM